MSRPERDKILEHEYDGIREFDNPLPGWWLAIFYGSIVWAAAYFAWYHLGPGLNNDEALKLARQQHEARHPKPVDALASVTGPELDSAILALAQDPAQVGKGQATYQKLCIACHGMSGEGLIGPNLTDGYWIHGSEPSAVYRTISEGVLEKGMLAWKAQLSPEEMRQVAAYVRSLRGTSPPNPKPPQGAPEPGSGLPPVDAAGQPLPMPAETPTTAPAEGAAPGETPAAGAPAPAAVPEGGTTGP